MQYTVKLTMNSDTGGIIIRITIGKVKGVKIINKQDFFAHFQTAGHSGFINDTEIRFIDKTARSDPATHEHFWVNTLKIRYSQVLNNIDTYHQLLFLQFY